MSDLPNPFIALVTGAARGIGAATVRRLAREPGCRLVLVDRQETALREFAEELQVPVTWVAADLTDSGAPEQIRDHVVAEHGQLHLLVNNAGARWTARFTDGGWENVRRTMAINFDAAVRLTEALLPILRESAPSAIVNVSSLGGRVARPGTGAYAASKAALLAWSDALSLEELTTGVHVGSVLPGYVVTEGFPQRELLARRLTRWAVARPDDAADAIVEVAKRRQAERYVPRGYALAAAARILFPRLVRRLLSSKGAAIAAPQSGSDDSGGAPATGGITAAPVAAVKRPIVAVGVASRASDLKLKTLRVEQDGRVLTARIDDPPYNFMTARMQQDIDALTRAVDGDPSVGAVVLTGQQPNRYITHFNNADIFAAAERAKRVLSESKIRLAMRIIAAVCRIPGGRKAIERTPLSGLLNVTLFNEVVMRIMRSPAVYIAAVNGPCGGGGLEMSVCFDVRIASETAGFAIPELLIGLTTTVGGQRLSRLVGPGRALEMMLEGRMYSAQEALEMGLVSRIVPAEQLVGTAQKLAARYAARNGRNIAAQKRIFNEDALLPPLESLRREGAANAAGILAGPAPRALRAWLEMQRRGGGESPFLTNLDAWTTGDVVDLNEQRGPS